jgi:hypothetical protein
MASLAFVERELARCSDPASGRVAKRQLPWAQFAVFDLRNIPLRGCYELRASELRGVSRSEISARMPFDN